MYRVVIAIPALYGREPSTIIVLDFTDLSEMIYSCRWCFVGQIKWCSNNGMVTCPHYGYTHPFVSGVPTAMTRRIPHTPAATINVTRPASSIRGINLYASKGKYHHNGQKQVKESFHLISFPTK